MVLFCQVTSVLRGTALLWGQAVLRAFREQPCERCLKRLAVFTCVRKDPPTRENQNHSL